MTPDVVNQLMLTLLLISLGTVLAVGSVFGFLIVQQVRKDGARKGENPAPDWTRSSGVHAAPGALGLEPPRQWCAVQTRSVRAVQTAVGLHNPRPCTWGEGMSQLGGHRLLISPPIQGWVFVIGHGLPDPGDDPDRSYHFLVHLSRTLGHVQFFSANRTLNHHAWVRAEDGKIRRAYAWAGETVWNQGEITREETELDLTCPGYGEPPGAENDSTSDPAQANTEKVNRLAARWSLDPTLIDDRVVASGQGVVGELTQLRPS